LYGIVIVATRFLAGSSVPADFGLQFGEPGSLGYAAGEAAVIAVFIFVIALAWAYATLRPYHKARRVFTQWCLVGLACGFLGAFMVAVLEAPDRGAADMAEVARLLLSPNEPPLWGILNLLAAPLGVWLAGRLVRRSVPTMRGRPLPVR
jgi:hypothetical protein